VKKVAVVTGGAGGMGLATARILGRDHQLVIADVNPQRLASAVEELTRAGFGCDAVRCDITDRQSVDALMARAMACGPVACVIHTAGISPQMADPQTIMTVNAIGTINIIEACHGIAGEGFALVNVASMSGYMIPGWLAPRRAYRLALHDTDRFLRRVLLPCRLMPNKLLRSGMAYSISKHFVSWLSRTSAGRFGEKGARVLSISPGTIDTEMGRLEEQSGSLAMLKTAALKRLGRPEEVAELLAFCASDKASYITGVDILCDGGVIAGRG